VRAVPLIALFLVLAAPARAEDPSIADGSAQRALDAARARWRERGLVSYRFRQTIGCFCPEEYRKPRTMTVRRRRAVRPGKIHRPYATAPKLFRVIQDAIDRRVARLTVTYGTVGLPRQIFIDYDEMIADEERGLGASRLRELK
jgi:hypothetical protein